MVSASVMLGALALEAAFGWPAGLYRAIRHPVVWLGALIAWLEERLNRAHWPPRLRYASGVMTTLLSVAIAAAAAWLIAAWLPDMWAGHAVETALAASLLAARSLHDHVAAVAAPLAAGNPDAARHAVAQIVGRDPDTLDAAGIARAALESLAENASDGVIAPLFWGVLLGLPGLAGYKAINTLDSMIGHRTDRYRAFGGFAARLDDAANWLPARLTGLMLVVVAGRAAALAVMTRDAPGHRSPNAGWPEAALAGALGVRLAGPRLYAGARTRDPWLNGAAPDPTAREIRRGLRLYRRAVILAALILAVAALGQWP